MFSRQLKQEVTYWVNMYRRDNECHDTITKKKLLIEVMKAKTDFYESLKGIQRKSQTFRGKVIETTIIIENVIQWICCHYFTEDDAKYKQLLEVIFYKNTFSTNEKILIIFLKFIS